MSAQRFRRPAPVWVVVGVVVAALVALGIWVASSSSPASSPARADPMEALVECQDKVREEMSARGHAEFPGQVSVVDEDRGTAYLTGELNLRDNASGWALPAGGWRCLVVDSDGKYTAVMVDVAR